MTRKTLIRLGLFFLALAFPSDVLPAFSPSSLNEYEVKTAFLYQFTKFVEWPDTRVDSPDFGICFLGDNSFEDILHQLDNEPVGERAVKTHISEDISQLTSCQILFISKSQKARLDRILEELQEKSVLTVGETQGFLEKGGIINFVKEGNKIRFNINQKQAEQAGIKISSKLLSVASKVIEK